VETREPVGSKSIVDRHAFGVSAATIRNDMALLEDEDLIVAPHTSSGRVPTDKGYRVFVDHLARIRPLSSAQRAAVATFLEGSGDLDDVLTRTVRALTRLTGQVAIVQYPSFSRANVSHVELVDLGGRMLVILVTDTGRVSQRIVMLPDELDETDVARISVGDSAAVDIDAFPDTTFVGRVVEIANSSLQNPLSTTSSSTSTDQAVDYFVKVQLINPPPDTRPDFSATAKIVTDTRRNVLAIPIIALTVREHQTSPNTDSAQLALGKQPQKQVGQKETEGVFIIGKDNRVTFRPVKIGIAGEEYFEVLSGLEPGETIVSGSYQAIHDLKDSTLVRETKVDDKTRTGSKT